MKTETEIRDVFDDIIIKIANEIDAMYLLHTKIVFDGIGFGNFALLNKNIIIFSLLDYNLNKDHGNFVEYKNVVDYLGIPYFVDNNDCLITTDTPEIYVIIHELAHIITYTNYPDVDIHGEEFCDIYREIIKFLKL